MGFVTRKQIIFSFAILLAFVIAHQIVYSLSFLDRTLSPEIYLQRCAVWLSLFLFVIYLGWISFHRVGGILHCCFAIIMTFFVYGVSEASIFIWFLFCYGVMCYVLYRIDETSENAIADVMVDREKYQNEKNDLELSYKVKGEGISILFEKYSTYYNLRKLAEELATTMSVTKLGEIVVQRTSEFISRGDHLTLILADASGQNLSVIASKALKKGSKLLDKEGDMFDHWSIKNRKRFIVMDTHQDFRFDVTQASKQKNLRSLIISPILYEGRVIGALRIHSQEPETFTNDDLRLLDAIAGLSSSAISNALLYEKTEELAIRDSLTGLYVRRYFYDRLKQEHKRALLTKRPLSLMMCDLDFFKECNDKYGHATGDLMLVKFAEIIKTECEAGFVARYGGEEFVVLLSESSSEEALDMAEKLRRKVETTLFEVRRESVQMTVSIGVASMPENTLDLRMLVQKADEALYEAKRSGRNRVCLSHD